jgi:hypothetical protein
MVPRTNKIRIKNRIKATDSFIFENISITPAISTPPVLVLIINYAPSREFEAGKNIIS